MRPVTSNTESGLCVAFYVDNWGGTADRRLRASVLLLTFAYAMTNIAKRRFVNLTCPHGHYRAETGE